MASIKITVPDGDKCTGCDFYKTIYRDRDCCEYECLIFGNKIELANKCVACKILGTPEVSLRASCQ
jgi:hypothetical protein